MRMICLVFLGVSEVYSSHSLAESLSAPEVMVRRFGRTTLRHWDRVVDLSTCHQKRVLASLGADGFARLWDANGTQIAQLQVGRGGTAVAISPHGEEVAIARDSAIWIWERKKQNKFWALVKLPEKGNSFRSLTYSGDGRYLGSVDSAYNFRLWATKGFKEVKYVAGGPAAVNDHGRGSIAFSSKHNVCMFSSLAGVLRILELSSGKIVRSVNAGASELTSLSISPNEDLLASGSWNGEVRVWKVATWELVFRHQFSQLGKVSVAFSQRGRHLIAGNAQGRVVVWKSGSFECEREFPVLAGPIVRMVCLADGKSLAVAGEQEAINTWDIGSGRRHDVESAHVHKVKWVSMAHEDRFVVTASEDGTAAVWETGTGELTATLKGYQGRHGAVPCVVSNHYIVTGGSDGVVRKWIIPDTRQVWSKRFDSDSQISHLIGSGGGAVIVAADTGGKIHCLDGKSGKRLGCWQMDHALWNLAASPTDPEVAVNFRNAIVLVDCKTGETRKHVEQSNPIQSVAYSSDGRMVALATMEEVCILERATMGEIRRMPLGHDGGVNTISFIGCDTMLSAGTSNGCILRWDISSGNVLPRFKGAGSAVLALADSYDGTHLLAGNSDTTASLWKLDRRRWHGTSFGFQKTPEDVLSALRVSAQLNQMPAGVWLWSSLASFAPSEIVLPDRLTEKQCESLWTSLMSQDVGRAYRALWILARCPTESVPFLRKRLRPVRDVSQEVIARHIQGLSKARYHDRRQSYRKLEELGDLAAQALHDRLAESPPLNELKDIKSLLAQNKSWRLNELQVLRAIQSLEYCGTTEAREALAYMSSGAPSSRVTRQAASSATRLAARLKRP